MDMKGERNVPVDQEEAWRALNDPDVLAACIPGCESMEQTGDNEFKARVRTSIGPVNSRFKGRVTLSDVNPPESYKLKFKGDGTAGFVQGSADVHLAPSGSGGGTTVSYEAQAKIGGKLAQIGSRLVDGAARKMADEFFSNLAAHMGGSAEPEPATEPVPEPSASGTAIDETKPDDSAMTRFFAAIGRILASLFGNRRNS